MLKKFGINLFHAFYFAVFMAGELSPESIAQALTLNQSTVLLGVNSTLRLSESLLFQHFKNVLNQQIQRI
jgi:hypothetical protein